MHRQKNRRAGFTIIEILISIGIIGILSTLATVSSFRAREAAKDAKVKEDLQAIRNGIGLLVQDTGKWPNGCPVDEIANPEINLTEEQAGLLTAPSVGDQGDGCFWTAGDVANWDGPYAQFGQDPWENSYYFDPDYDPWKNCSSKTTRTERPAILSFGPDGVGINTYDCDDIYIDLR